MKKIILLSIVCSFIGCASAFIPSTRIQSLRNGMTPEQAAAVVAKHMSPSPSQSGLCAAYGAYFDEGTPVTATPESYSFKSYKRGEKIREEKIGTSLYRYYKKVYFTRQTRFADVRKIRVIRAVSSVGDCKVSGSGTYSVAVYTGTSDNHNMFVAEQNFDEFMAALTKLAPQARLMEGAGF